MNIVFLQNHSVPIPQEQSVTPIRASQVLAGGNRFVLRNEYGTVLLQQYDGTDFAIVYGIIECSKNLTTSLPVSSSGMHFFTSLTNGVKLCYMETKQTLRAGFFTFLQASDASVDIHSKKNEHYAFMYIHYRERLFKSLPPNVVTCIKSRFNMLNNPMLQTIQGLINCNYETNLLHFYYENQVRGLLFLMITSRKTEQLNENFTLAEHHIIHSVDNEMRFNPAEHRSLQDIAMRYGLSQYKLKEGFKQLLGMGIFSRLLHWRMELACRLLVETIKPVKEITFIAGYKRVTSFITIFRKRTGITPKEYRDKYSKYPSPN